MGRSAPDDHHLSPLGLPSIIRLPGVLARKCPARQFMDNSVSASDPATELRNRCVIGLTRELLHRRPPLRFAFKIHPPEKIGLNHAYGLTVYPVSNHGAPIATAYQIWRSWQDCLFLQEFLEMGYSKLMTGATSARASTGFLQSKDQVSDPSFKSPIDRKHLADVHVHIPRLTYRGVLLKASPALIAQRGAEFANFINVLLGDGLPPALRRLRSDRLIHDFFGQRLKDYDRAREPPPSPPGLPMEPEASAEPDADHLSIGIGTALTEDSRPPSSFRLSWSIASVDFRDTSEDFPEEDESGVVDPALASHEPSAPVFSLSNGSSESSSTIREAQAARRAMDINN